MLYAGYGSNLNRAQMKERCPRAEPLTANFLNNWELCFKGVADISPVEGASVNVGVYIITKECEDSLDFYEDYPRLYRKEFIYLDGYNEPILTYVMNLGYGFGPPSTFYFKAIEEGYKNWNMEIKDLLKAAYKSLKGGVTDPYLSYRWKGKEMVTKTFLDAINLD